MWIFLSFIGGVIVGALGMFLIFGNNYKKFSWAYNVIQNYSHEIQREAQEVRPRLEALEQRIEDVIQAIKAELEALRGNRG